MERQFVDKLFTIAGESIDEYHQARLLYENSEKEANEAMNIAKKKKQKSEELLLNLIKKEEEKNEENNEEKHEENNEEKNEENNEENNEETKQINIDNEELEYNKMNVKALRDLLQERNIRTNNKMKKNELISLLTNKKSLIVDLAFENEEVELNNDDVDEFNENIEEINE